MKLLVGTHYFDTHKGGVEVVAAELARALALDEGIEVTWLASDASPPPAEFPGRTLPVACWNLLERRVGIPLPLPSPSAIAAIHDAVAANDAVLLHDALYPTNVVMAARAHRLEKPLLVVQHVGLVPYRNPLARGLMRAGNGTIATHVLRSADRVVFISGITKAYFAPRVRFRHPPAMVFNGLRSDLPDLDSLIPRQDARRRLGLETDRFTALFVGRFVEKKGLEVIARMARDLPDVQWVFCGWGPMDPARWNEPNVRVLGAASGTTLADAYRAADTLVLPSVGEGLPLVVQEALAMGTGVVGSDDLLLADPWLRDRVVTAPVNHGDIDSTAVAWSQVIEKLRRSGGPPARPAEVRERYDWRSSARAYAVMLRELVSAGEQRSGPSL